MSNELAELRDNLVAQQATIAALDGKLKSLGEGAGPQTKSAPPAVRPTPWACATVKAMAFKALAESPDVMTALLAGDKKRGYYLPLSLARRLYDDSGHGAFLDDVLAQPGVNCEDLSSLFMALMEQPKGLAAVWVDGRVVGLVVGIEYAEQTFTFVRGGAATAGRGKGKGDDRHHGDTATAARASHRGAIHADPL
jgi:hypothetical protein